MMIRLSGSLLFSAASASSRTPSRPKYFFGGVPRATRKSSRSARPQPKSRIVSPVGSATCASALNRCSCVRRLAHSNARKSGPCRLTARLYGCRYVGCSGWVTLGIIRAQYTCVMVPDWLNVLQTALADEFGNDRPRICALATVSDIGEPAARCVVCRRLARNGYLYLVSDGRSRKNAELRAHRAAELVFWLAKRREQFRISGLADVG